jgi:CBS domain-containing protein
MKLSDRITSILQQKGSSVCSVTPSQSVYEAIELMASKGIGALLVIVDNKLVGIMSERDYARKVVLKGRTSKATQVADIMTSPVIFVTPQNTVDECMAIMTKSRIRHLPVMEQEKVIGIISIGDLVKWIIAEQEGGIRNLEFSAEFLPPHRAALLCSRSKRWRTASSAVASPLVGCRSIRRPRCKGVRESAGLPLPRCWRS